MAEEPADEAQAIVVTSVPKGPLPVHLTEFSITLSVGASIEVNGKDWMKTGAEAGAKWDSVPDPATIKKTVAYVQGTLLGPVVEESIIQITKALEARQKM